MEQGNLHRASEICRMGETEFHRYAIDFMRLRAESHVILGQAQEAQTIYQELLATRVVAWARLGLAKILFMQEKFGEAEQLLVSLVGENRKYMDACDWLAKIHEAIGRLADAKNVLAEAAAISPHAVRRLRKLGDVAHERIRHRAIGNGLSPASIARQEVAQKFRWPRYQRAFLIHHEWTLQQLRMRGQCAQQGIVIRLREIQAEVLVFIGTHHVAHTGAELAAQHG